MLDAKCFLYKIVPVRPDMVIIGPTPEEEKIVADHFAYLKRLTEEGVVILVGRTQNADYSTFGIAIFRADSEEAARKIMNDDPAVKQRVMRGELYPYRVALLGNTDGL